MNVNEQLAQWRHDSKWNWLRNRLTYEYQQEFVMSALRQSKQPVTNFRIDAKLKQLLGLR